MFEKRQMMIYEREKELKKRVHLRVYNIVIFLFYHGYSDNIE